MIGERTRDDTQKKLSAYEAAANELVLYLDTHPKDQNALVMYRELVEVSKKMAEDYQNRFGPLTTAQAGKKDQWDWTDSPFPWEV